MIANKKNTDKQINNKRTVTNNKYRTKNNKQMITKNNKQMMTKNNKPTNKQHTNDE